MASINSRLLLVAALFAVTVICLDNDTTGASETSKEPKPSGALASLGRMIIDIPLGVVEAFKDVSFQKLHDIQNIHIT
ncbi:unnamed protein product [Euphydryas editha]|uniref:Uncharacterized protein n=1 Tax=Euphydryas editha TaxID=104508 RepID=A0AAU9TYU8_EUPED|nr:unnamed protein product [Euphydryas editha]